MRNPPSTLKTSLLFTLGVLAVAAIAVGLLGVYGIVVTVVVALAGFHVLTRWYHRRYHSAAE